MNISPPQKNEIFFLLALEQRARQKPAAYVPTEEEIEFEDEGENTRGNLTEEDFPALFEQLSEIETTKLSRLLADYKNKTEAEKKDWREKIRNSIGADNRFIDANIHLSHIENALKREIPAIRKIISDSIAGYETAGSVNRYRHSLEKNICRSFASQFVSFGEIENASAFDKLSGSQLARLIRLAGVREVATACLRIEAVEAVAAFIRNFPAEDARMIAVHLANVPEIPEERIGFAENLVHTAFEIEPNPSAMLDWLGIRLTGVLLCQSSPSRIIYTRQKLPLEFALLFPKMIEEHCRQTPLDMQKTISGEIERLAVTVAGNG